ncbi:ricin-type beta-trefoil lectin domain protein [Actinokineospora sp. HUAS TT18]|uniref:ricin-type beta-trefoil lectin domain protein n=1 Tax=Actinokineospora sp. HUAS TT18 TaxID=3447451 RepID=UPI003F524B37
MGPTRYAIAVCAAAFAALGVVALPPSPAAAADVVPLPAALEAIRAAEATALYGSPEIRPIEQRKTSVISAGDSEISGEGAYDLSLYEPGTNGPVSYCHRSVKAAIKVVDIPADVKSNIACSGGRNENLRFQGPGTFEPGDNQGNKLAIQARNTRVKLIWLVMGANDYGGIEFGPLMTKCSENRIFFKGTCWQSESGNEVARFTVVRNGLKGGIADIRAIMRDAGYQQTDYQLIVSSYPSPVSPDVEDNPNFPGWYGGGCLLYLADHAAGRNKVVPMFEEAVRDAALSTGTRYADASRLYAGHEPCTQSPWVTGLYNSSGNVFDPNAWRQSWHPNVAGHEAFARCMRDMYNSGAATGSCYDPASTNSSVFRAGLLEFKQVQNPVTGLCVDADGYSSRNGYRLLSYPCHGGRNQGWWYDPTNQSIHSQLTHDRCWDIDFSQFTPGTRLQMWDCNGGNAQKWILDGDLVRVKADPSLCAAHAAGANPVGGAMTLARCDGSANQKLRFSTLTGAFRNLATPANGWCLDVPGNAPSNGAKLLSWTCEFGSADQKWSANPVARQVINARSPGYCLDASNAVAGAPVQVWQCKDQVGQYDANGRWQLGADGYLFQPRDPNLVATAATTQGGQVTLQPRDPAKAGLQKWGWNATQELRIAYGYDQWMPSSVY